ncbi:ricin-type beta-trefoil lectin domain protein [Streptomyces sp. BE20]|uniref:RICIN domain-containing protein n=1 Tax=Streptomyces sp. BE20 TaxID=3002525 RepID=UPI002E76270C|nr:ricin-type beta-trefoil lectin domain protein [Streptomyces sp. BE20]MEE1825670.1 ricin-type beta-trefoil lectin domain protein [Streptomyces sp. BE20]
MKKVIRAGGAATLGATLVSATLVGAANPASAETTATRTQVTAQSSSAQLAGLTVAGQHYQNANSGKCLVVQGSTYGNGAFQYTCDDFDDQKWTVRWVTQTKAQIGKVGTNLCLVVQGQSNGSGAFQYGCDSRFNDQLWYTYRDSAGRYQFENANSNGKCLVVQGMGLGNAAFQYDCVNTFEAAKDQWWVVY